MSDASFRSLNMGNTADDDAQVIESLVQATDTPPDFPVGPIVNPALPEPEVPTRLISVHQSVDPTWTSPTLILPADTARKYLTVRVTSEAATATDGVAIVSEMKGSTSKLAILYHGQTLPLDGHTGAVWALGTGAAAVSLDVWSVTK